MKRTNENRMKIENKGITLVALVITIVVLIILAGVAINLSLGENGIFNKAKEAKIMQLKSEYREKIGTEILAAQIDAISRDEDLEDEQVKDIISNYGELQDDGDTIKITDKDVEVSLSEIYTGTTTSSGSYTENKAKIAMLEKRIKELQEQLDNASLSGDEKDKKIAELNSKITELENQKTTLETKVASLEKDKENLENNVTTLQQEKTELTNQVSNLQDEITNSKSKIAAAITSKGVSTKADDSWETIVSNISSIQTGIKQFNCTYASMGQGDAGSCSLTCNASGTCTFYFASTCYRDAGGTSTLYFNESAIRSHSYSGYHNSSNATSGTISVSKGQTFKVSTTHATGIFLAIVIQ